MRHLKEVQSIRDNRPIFILMLLALGLPMLGMFFPLFMNKSSGSEDWVAIAMVPAVLALTLFILLKMKTEVIIKEDKVSYRSNPFSNKQKEIRLTDISNYKIADHKWTHGLGYKRTLGGGRVYVMCPGKVLAITTRDGRNFRFGINRPAAIQKFITSNWEEKHSAYG